MSGAPRAYVVTPRSGEPYGVRLTPSAGTDEGGWIGEVGRGEERWTFELASGEGEGRLRVGDRSFTWHWNAVAGELALNGETHELTVETEAAHRLAALGVRSSAGVGVVEVRAPMPGLVIAVLVVDGKLVSAGERIAIIEAMKMENEITAPSAGIVRGVGVSSGEAVDRGALLCRIEPPAAGAP